MSTSTAHEPLNDDPLYPGPTRRSSLAVLALVLSVLPFLSVLGPVLGGVALVRMRGNPRLEGRGFAWCSIVLGTVVSLAVFLLAWQTAAQIRQVVMLPDVALRAAERGDGAAFRSTMTGPGATVESATLVAWARTLQERFGPLQKVELAEHAPATTPSPGEHGDRMAAAYIVIFERAQVPATVLFEVPPQSISGLLQARIRRITLEPPGESRIVFPDDEPSQQP